MYPHWCIRPAVIGYRLYRVQQPYGAQPDSWECGLRIVIARYPIPPRSYRTPPPSTAFRHRDRVPRSLPARVGFPALSSALCYASRSSCFRFFFSFSSLFFLLALYINKFGTTELAALMWSYRLFVADIQPPAITRHPFALIRRTLFLLTQENVDFTFEPLS